MKTLRLIPLLLTLCINSFGQSQMACQLDSARRALLSPKLEQYDQQVEKFTDLISATDDKKRIRQYAKQIAQVSDAMESEIASLYNYNGGGGGFYVGTGVGPWGWYGPAMGGMIYSPASSAWGYGYLPPVYYDVDRIKRSANNMRLFARHKNVVKKVEFIHKKSETLKNACSKGAC